MLQMKYKMLSESAQNAIRTSLVTVARTSPACQDVTTALQALIDTAPEYTIQEGAQLISTLYQRLGLLLNACKAVDADIELTGHASAESVEMVRKAIKDTEGTP